MIANLNQAVMVPLMRTCFTPPSSKCYATLTMSLLCVLTLHFHRPGVQAKHPVELQEKLASLPWC
jgi:F0F1-type ATP synthase membrane subunit a